MNKDMNLDLSLEMEVPNDKQAQTCRLSSKQKDECQLCAGKMTTNYEDAGAERVAMERFLSKHKMDLKVLVQGQQKEKNGSVPKWKLWVDSIPKGYNNPRFEPNLCTSCSIMLGHNLPPLPPAPLQTHVSSGHSINGLLLGKKSSSLSPLPLTEQIHVQRKTDDELKVANEALKVDHIAA